MAAIGTLAMNVVMRTAQFDAKSKQMKGKVGGLQRSVGGLGAGLKGLTAALGPVAIALAAVGAAAVAARKAIQGVKQAFVDLDAVAKSSRALGLTTEALTGLQFAANQTGASNEELNKGLQRLLKSVSDAKVGLSTAKRGFEQLGLSVSDLENLSPDEIFTAVAGAMPNVEKQTDKVRIAMDLLGRSGVKLLNTMALGAEGLQEYRDEAERLGLAVSEDQTRAIEAANDAVDTMNKAFKGLFQQVAIALAPAIINFAKVVTEFVVTLKDVVVETRRWIKENETMINIISPITLLFRDWTGATTMQTKALEAMIPELETVVELTEEQKKAIDAGKRVIESTRTPLERYIAKMKDLKALLKVGALGEGPLGMDTFRRAVAAANDELDKAGPKTRSLFEAAKATQQNQFAGAVRRGTQAAAVASATADANNAAAKRDAERDRILSEMRDLARRRDAREREERREALRLAELAGTR